MMQGPVLTLSAQVNCTCCQRSVWLGLTSAILQFLFSLLICFKWYLPHGIDSKARKSTRDSEYGNAVLGLCLDHGYFFQLKQVCVHSRLTTVEDNV